MDDCLGGLINAYETSDTLVQMFRVKCFFNLLFTNVKVFKKIGIFLLLSLIVCVR
jgi:hypothetical protein